MDRLAQRAAKQRMVVGDQQMVGGRVVQRGGSILTARMLSLFGSGGHRPLIPAKSGIHRGGEGRFPDAV